MKTVIILLTACWLLGCAAKTEPLPAPGLTDQIYYFPETGHTVQDPFLVYYLAHDGPLRYGYPLTEAMSHEGWQVQYFQYARLEVHPENHPDYFITVGWLGQLSHRTKPAQPFRGGEAGRYYPETGHTLRGDFLTYFDSQGDTVQFGWPISEVSPENGRLYQDFQSARFYWRPDLQPQARVQREPIGETYFLNSNLPSDLLDPLPEPDAATRFSSSSNLLPAQTKATLLIEPTARPEIIRLIATLFADDQPVVDYAPLLVLGNQARPLPPTRSSGQTHILFNIAAEANITFELKTETGGKVLAKTAYHASLP
jgi:hypothetical protein